ncbi:unnamed protein product [Ectocarpus sp. CCAP 1310/34]|nr:unnamed protein product [Ectocarpus sp. CCAP 1310/34]
MSGHCWQDGRSAHAVVSIFPIKGENGAALLR